MHSASFFNLTRNDCDTKESMTTNTFNKGDAVQWESPQGTVYGTVKKKLTAPMKIKDHEVAASPDDPQYLVVSDKTGAEAAHKPHALRKR